MAFFLVRTISRKNLVGLFFAESLPHLVVDVSKVVNTEDCECAELPGGGIYWRSSNTRIPLEGGRNPPWERSEITPNWKKILEGGDMRWIPLLSTEDIAR